MSISIQCNQCRTSIKAPDSAAGKTGKCPACGERMLIPMPEAKPMVVADMKPKLVKAATPAKGTVLLNRDRVKLSLEEVTQDFHFKIAAWLSGGALLLLALSPLFKWITFGAGGVTGIQGDGKYVLALSIAAIAASSFAIFTRRRFSLLVLASQAWGTIAVILMGSLIWKIGSIFDDPKIGGNPFTAILATQIGPGAGLYMGLIGGILAAGALGFIIVRHLHENGKIRSYYISQTIAVGLGIGIAILLGSNMSKARSSDSLTPLTSTDGDSNMDKIGRSPILTPDKPKTPRMSGVTLTPTLKSKRFQKSEYQEFVWLDIDWQVTKAEKPIRAVKGRLLLQDLFGETKFAIGWSITRSLSNGESFAEREKGFKYNQFMASHEWVRSTDESNIKIAFEVQAVVYQDGTSEGVAEDAPHNSIITPVLLKKEAQKKDFQEFIWMTIRWDTDKLPKATRAVKGVLHLTDAFGESQFRLNVTLDEPLEPGKPYVQEGTGFHYNQFISAHAWVRNASNEEIHPVFVPSSVIFADGTRKDY